MNTPKQLELLHDEQVELSARQVNILLSPKQNGTGSDDAKSYLNELGIEIIDKRQPIQFQRNSKELLHRWSPYVQGFSALFVQKTLDEYKNEYSSPVIFVPFAGSGTVLVQSMLNNLDVYGLELNPLLHFIAKTKIKI